MRRFVYFDLGNVLLPFDHVRQCKQMAANAGGHWQQYWDAIFASGLEERFETGLISAADFHAEVGQKTGIPQGPMQPFEDAVGDIFHLNGAMLPIVAQLRSSGVPIGILSNTHELHWDFCLNKRFRFLKLCFEVYALSFELKTMKPNPKIYLLAAELAGREPHEIFFVDDRQENVASAQETGCHAVLFKSAQGLAQDLRDWGLTINT